MVSRLTVWKDGAYVFHGYRDAEITTRCEPEAVVLNLDMETFDCVTFPDLQARTQLYEKLLRLPGGEKLERPIPPAPQRVTKGYPAWQLAILTGAALLPFLALILARLCL